MNDSQKQLIEQIYGYLSQSKDNKAKQLSDDMECEFDFLIELTDEFVKENERISNELDELRKD